MPKEKEHVLKTRAKQIKTSTDISLTWFIVSVSLMVFSIITIILCGCSLERHEYFQNVSVDGHVVQKHIIEEYFNNPFCDFVANGWVLPIILYVIVIGFIIFLMIYNKKNSIKSKTFGLLITQLVLFIVMLCFTFAFGIFWSDRIANAWAHNLKYYPFYVNALLSLIYFIIAMNFVEKKLLNKCRRICQKENRNAEYENLLKQVGSEAFVSMAHAIIAGKASISENDKTAEEVKIPGVNKRSNQLITSIIISIIWAAISVVLFVYAIVVLILSRSKLAGGTNPAYPYYYYMNGYLESYLNIDVLIFYAFIFASLILASLIVILVYNAKNKIKSKNLGFIIAQMCIIPASIFILLFVGFASFSGANNGSKEFLFNHFLILYPLIANVVFTGVYLFLTFKYSENKLLLKCENICRVTGHQKEYKELCNKLDSESFVAKANEIISQSEQWYAVIKEEAERREREAQEKAEQERLAREEQLKKEAEERAAAVAEEKGEEVVTVEEKKEPVAKKERSEISVYTGNAFVRFLLWLGGVCASCITFGLLYPLFYYLWTKYDIDNTYISGKKLIFVGKIGSIYGKMILYILLSIITFGIYAFFMSYKLTRWRIENTVVQGESGPSVFRGNVYEFIGLTILNAVFSIITLFIYRPVAISKKIIWEYNNSTFSGRKVKFTSNEYEFVGRNLIWLILSIITLGIYLIFKAYNVMQWKVRGCKFE